MLTVTLTLTVLYLFPHHRSYSRYPSTFPQDGLRPVRVGGPPHRRRTGGPGRDPAAPFRPLGPGQAGLRIRWKPYFVAALLTGKGRAHSDPSQTAKLPPGSQPLPDCSLGTLGNPKTQERGGG